MQERLKKALWQIPLLIVMAGLIAIGVNSLRADGIALVGKWSVGTPNGNEDDHLVIGIEDARRLFQQEGALFLDARPRKQYDDGHIRGAFSLPWQEVDRYFLEIADRLDGAAMIIIYCDGKTCDLSRMLAGYLKEMGFENVRVLVNGWTVWKQAGLPIQEKKTP